MNENRDISLHAGAIKLLSVSHGECDFTVQTKTALSIRISLHKKADCMEMKIAIKQEAISRSGVAAFVCESCSSYYCTPCALDLFDWAPTIQPAVRRAIDGHQGLIAGLHAERKAPKMAMMDLPDLPISEYIVFGEF